MLIVYIYIDIYDIKYFKIRINSNGKGKKLYIQYVQ